MGVAEAQVNQRDLVHNEVSIKMHHDVCALNVTMTSASTMQV